MADRQTALLRSPRANWFVLDSLEKTNSTPGWLGDEQRTWLARALDENPDKPALVVAHHNPLLAGDAELALKDSVQFFDILRPRRQVKAYIFGHTHRWETTQDVSGIHLVNLPPPPMCSRQASRTAGFMPAWSATARGWNCVASITITRRTARWWILNGAPDEVYPIGIRLIDECA